LKINAASSLVALAAHPNKVVVGPQDQSESRPQNGPTNSVLNLKVKKLPGRSEFSAAAVSAALVLPDDRRHRSSQLIT